MILWGFKNHEIYFNRLRIIYYKPIIHVTLDFINILYHYFSNYAKKKPQTSSLYKIECTMNLVSISGMIEIKRQLFFTQLN